MGFLKDISKWLSGGKNKGGSSSPAIKLKVFNKRLMRQTKKLEISAKLARDKAVNLRKEGDMEGSKFHARNYLQTKKQARAIDGFRTNLEGLLFKIEQANAVKDVAQIMTGIAQSLSTLKNQFSIPQLTEMMKSIDIDMEDFAVTAEITSEGIDSIQLDTAITDSEVNNVLGEMDAEIQVEMGVALPSAGSDEKITELEKELNRLKSDE
uniref:Putative Vps2/24/46-like protein n=1 Tax=uncultured organism TaxID=155900 RepID=A0A0F6PYJ3_9ZZZZ|nr:putative Vps2/24/46-like protein [uncultured organism]